MPCVPSEGARPESIGDGYTINRAISSGSVGKGLTDRPLPFYRERDSECHLPLYRIQRLTVMNRDYRAVPV